MSTETPTVMAVIDARQAGIDLLAMAAGKPILQWVIESVDCLPTESKCFVCTDSILVWTWVQEYSGTKHGNREIYSFHIVEEFANLTQRECYLKALRIAADHFGMTAEYAVLRGASAPLLTASIVHGLLREIVKHRADVAVPVLDGTPLFWREQSDEVQLVGLPEMPDHATVVSAHEALAIVRVSKYVECRGQFRERVVGDSVNPDDVLVPFGPAGLAIVRAALQFELIHQWQQQLPNPIDAVVFDFDGVFTDNRVWVTQDGQESAACDRGDGMGIGLLKKTGIPLLVLSKEPVPIVVRRCEKLGLECLHGVDDKLPLLKAWLEERGLALENTIYMGNDVNDRECLAAAGCGVVPSDGHPDVMPLANMVLDKRGGHGAVRQLCDLILKHLAK